VEHDHILGLEAVGDADILFGLHELLSNKSLSRRDFIVDA
jgi:hypothetical protein